ncbi:MAG: hypothetical protein HUJ66_06825 [Oscillospiraceae bacterium]|nr:hypothetical protein [Oscillospiraceae bacterium]
MENKSKLKASWAVGFTVASMWFGTHVGGGFASGNQVVTYFSQYGGISLIYPIIAMGLLALVMYVMMDYSRLIGATNYKDTFRSIYPAPWMEVFFEIFYIIILLAGVAGAVAGAGEVLANFIGVAYVGAGRIIMNLIIVVLLIVLCIFGVNLVRAASTVLSIGILITTAIVVIAGFAADFDTICAQLLAENNIEAAAHSSAPVKQFIMGVINYAGFQCVSIPVLIVGCTELSHKGVKRASILGWLMNGLALCASAAMLSRWYPLLQALQANGIEGFLRATSGIPNQTVLNLIGIKWIIFIFSVLLFCAFVSTSVTLVYTMIQRFEGSFFPKSVKSEKVRSICVGVIVIAICFSISLLGLGNIVKYAYGYDGYYAILVVFIPVLIWGIPKLKKLRALQADTDYMKN